MSHRSGTSWIPLRSISNCHITIISRLLSMCLKTTQDLTPLGIKAPAGRAGQEPAVRSAPCASRCCPRCRGPRRESGGCRACDTRKYAAVRGAGTCRGPGRGSLGTWPWNSRGAAAGRSAAGGLRGGGSSRPSSLRRHRPRGLRPLPCGRDCAARNAPAERRPPCSGYL